MHRRQSFLLFLVLGAFIAVGCDSKTAAPTAPQNPVSSAAPSPMPTPSGFGSAAIIPAAAGRCQFAGEPACTAGPTGAGGVHDSRVTAASVPAAPGSLSGSGSGGHVVLSWTAPGSGDPVTSYVIEAGSSSGLANLANFSTGSTATSFVADGVGAGSYYVRVRAQSASGVSSASNEIVLVVTSPGGCTSAPNAPGSLTSSVSGSAVSLAWSAPSGGCAATSYILQAGSATGQSNLANANVGNTLSYRATGVGNGTYYIRVVAVNAYGAGAASNEVAAIVGPTTGGGLTGFVGLGGCTWIPPGSPLATLPGWIGCKANITVNIKKPVTSGTVSAYLLWNNYGDLLALGGNVTWDWYFHGSAQVTPGSVPGTITISTTGTYMPWQLCSNEIPVSVIFTDGPDSSGNTFPKTPVLYMTAGPQPGGPGTAYGYTYWKGWTCGNPYGISTPQ